jgi:hypothetical protein
MGIGCDGWCFLSVVEGPPSGFDLHLPVLIWTIGRLDANRVGTSENMRSRDVFVYACGFPAFTRVLHTFFLHVVYNLHRALFASHFFVNPTP